MKKLVKYLLKRELMFTLAKNEDGDDYHLEFSISNEYYEVRTKQEARKLLKYLKEMWDYKGYRRQIRKIKRAIRQLEAERRNHDEDI